MLNIESILRVNQGLRIFKQRDASRTSGALANRSVKNKLASAYQLLTEDVVQKGRGVEGEILFRLCVCPVNEFHEGMTVSSSLQWAWTLRSRVWTAALSSRFILERY